MLILACGPTEKDLAESLATLNYGMRARGSEISFGSKDSFKKWKDAVSSGCVHLRIWLLETTECTYPVTIPRDQVLVAMQLSLSTHPYALVLSVLNARVARHPSQRTRHNAPVTMHLSRQYSTVCPRR